MIVYLKQKKLILEYARIANQNLATKLLTNKKPGYTNAREPRNNCIITSRALPENDRTCFLISPHPLSVLIASQYLYQLQDISSKHFFPFSAPDAWAQSQPANMAQIQDMEVQCEKDLFRVSNQTPIVQLEMCIGSSIAILDLIFFLFRSV